MLRPLPLLALASLVNGTCFSMLLPLLAPLVRQLQLTELQGGIMVTAAAIAMTLASLMKAKTAMKAKSGRSVLPVTLIVHGFWGMTITWAIFAACLYWGLQGIAWPWLLFIVLVLSRAATGWYMAYVQIGIQSAVMQTVQQTSQRRKNMAALGAANSLGMIMGPLLTSALVMFGILTPIWFAVALFATLTLILQQHFNAQHASVENTENSQINHHLQLEQPEHCSVTRIVWRHHMVWFALGFVLALAIVTLNMTAGFYIQDQFGLNTVQSAIHFAQCLVIAAVVLLLCQFGLARYLTIGLTGLVVIGCSSMIIGLMLSVQAITIMQFKFSYLFYGLAVACLTPAFSTGAAQSVEKQLQLKMASYCTAAQSMGFVVGPILSTALYQISAVMPFYLVLGCILLVFVYFIITIIFKRRGDGFKLQDLKQG